MTSELIKLLAPWLFIATWGLFALRIQSYYLIGASLFFASYAAFSQNFSFVYRELHQLIQLFLIATFFIKFTQHNRLNKFNYIFFALLVFVLNSILFSVFDEDARIQTINLFIIILMINFLYYSIKQKNSLHQLLIFFSQLSVLAAAIGVVEYIFTQNTRIEATTANSNYYAYFLGIGFCVAYEKYHGTHRLLIALLIITAIILSGSRAALVFPAIHLAIVSTRSHNNLRKKFIPFFVLSLVALLVFLSGSSRLSSTDTDSSDAERLIFVRIALTMAKDHPLTGIGWGRFPSEFSSYASSVEQIIVENGDTIDASIQDRRVTHNDLARILAELGWPAAIASLWLCFLSLKKAYILGRLENAYLFSCLSGSLLFSLAHNNLNSILFWFFLLLPFMLESIQKKQLTTGVERSF